MCCRYAVADDMFAAKDEEISRLLRELSAAKSAVDKIQRNLAMARGEIRGRGTSNGGAAGAVGYPMPNLDDEDEYGVEASIAYLLGEPDPAQRAAMGAEETAAESAEEELRRRKFGGDGNNKGGGGGGGTGTWGGGLSALGIDGKKALKRAARAAAAAEAREGNTNGAGGGDEQGRSDEEDEDDGEQGGAASAQLDVAAIMELARMQARRDEAGLSQVESNPVGP